MRSVKALVWWLLIDFTLMQFSVLWLHGAWYAHNGFAVAIDSAGITFWTYQFWKDIQRWTGPKRAASVPQDRR
jgi:hypothetical protein